MEMEKNVNTHGLMMCATVCWMWPILRLFFAALEVQKKNKSTAEHYVHDGGPAELI